VSAAVLNLSGWYDEAYGPEGAVTNFNGLMQARASTGRAARTHLMLGPWVHGVSSTESRRTGEVDFGPAAAIDYDDVVLDFLDHYVRGVDNEFTRAPPVRYFTMGANEWHEESQWPPAAAKTVTLYLAAQGNTRGLDTIRSAGDSVRSELLADPRDPVFDLHDEFGPQDYSQLHERSRPRHDLLTFDTEPLEHDWLISGAIAAEVSVSCDCRDFDLWVRLLDVHPDGRAFNLMSPGNDVLRASYRAGGVQQLLEPGRVYLLRLPNLHTSIRLAKGHRLRAQLSASFAPPLSRNLQTGESEVSGSASQAARILVHHDGAEGSRLVIPVLSWKV
jgi:putative CocE/NonD family hydrolase